MNTSDDQTAPAPAVQPVPPGHVTAPLIAGEPATPTDFPAAGYVEPTSFVEDSIPRGVDHVATIDGTVPIDRYAIATEKEEAEHLALCEEWLAAEKAAWKAWLDAEREAWRHPGDLPAGWTELEYLGDTLHVKIPSKGMVNALLHAGTTSDQFQSGLVAMFETEHISVESRERVISRMIDADDPVYGSGDEFDELSQTLARLAAERDQKAAQALAKLKQ